MVEFNLVLRTFADFFDHEGIRYALVGGLAVHAWGRTRPTRDADFAVDRDNQQRVVSFATSLGYESIHLGSAFSNHEHSDVRWGHVDFMYLAGATADAVFAGSSLKDILEGRPLSVASPEHLSMMKARAMKNFPHRALYEGDDVRVLLQVPGVDREAVRDYFQRMGLLDLYDAIEKAR